MQQRSSYRLPIISFSLMALLVGCGQQEGEISHELSPELTDASIDFAPESGHDASVPPARDGSSAVSPPDEALSPGEDEAASDQQEGGEPGSTATGSASATLHVEGNRIFDTCGEPWMARGMEQLAAPAFAADGTLAGLAQELIATGSNAVRLLPHGLTAAEIDALLTQFAAAKVVVYLSPGDRAWFKRSDMREVLLRHEKGLIIDAFQEPDYDDVPRWVEDAKAAVADVRGAGYTAPLTVLANQYGRDLTAALQHGQEIVDTDPLHNTIVGWQAYWGESGWYVRLHGMTLTEGVERCAAQGFPMQIGIDLYADHDDPMDYAAVMAAAQAHHIGWLWWNFWNQWDDMGNNASVDGTAGRLTSAGEEVIHSDPNGIARTASKACFR